MRRTESEAKPPIDRQLVSLAWLAERWACSRQSVRRVMQRNGVQPVYLGDARNGLVRFDLADVLRVEAEAQTPSKK